MVCPIWFVLDIPLSLCADDFLVIVAVDLGVQGSLAVLKAHQVSQMSDTYVKKRLLQKAIAHIKSELETAKLAADEAKNAATDEQSIAETQYDTLAIEASYLAHGQSVRYYELKNELVLLENFTCVDFDEGLDGEADQLVSGMGNRAIFSKYPVVFSCLYQMCS